MWAWAWALHRGAVGSLHRIHTYSYIRVAFALSEDYMPVQVRVRQQFIHQQFASGSPDDAKGEGGRLAGLYNWSAFAGNQALSLSAN